MQKWRQRRQISLHILNNFAIYIEINPFYFSSDFDFLSYAMMVKNVYVYCKRYSLKEWRHHQPLSICTPIQTQLVTLLPGGRPQTASITISNSLAENNSISHSGFYPMNISALNFNPVRRNVNLILEHNNKEWLLRYPLFFIYLRNCYYLA